MQIQKTLLFIFFAAVAHTGLSQKDSTQTSVPFVFKPARTLAPLVVLKSDDRTMELDPRNDEIFDFESIDAKFVKSITLLNDKTAKDTYGDRGTNGVLMVHLIDNYIFSKAIYKKIVTDE